MDQTETREDKRCCCYWKHPDTGPWTSRMLDASRATCLCKLEISGTILLHNGRGFSILFNIPDLTNGPILATPKSPDDISLW